MKKILGTLLLSSLILSTFVLNSCNQKEKDNGYIVKVGDTAPNFTATMINGKKFTLSEHRGKVVMLQFTASWCGVCRKEMPHIENEIWLPLQNDSFVLVGIDRDEPLDVVTEFAKKLKITYPLALDPGGEIFALYAMKGSGITRNVVIDENGKIICLTRLFNEKEFNGMKKIIFKQLKNLNSM
jgi:peroxiredoxin